MVCGEFFSEDPGASGRAVAGRAFDPHFLEEPLQNVFEFLFAPFVCTVCRTDFIPLESPFCSQCGLRFKSRVGEDHLCGDCLAAPKSFRIARSVGMYDRPLMELLHGFKYRGKIQLNRPLSALLLCACLKYWKNDHIDLVVPVPLHPKKMRRRGFNQTRLLVGEWGRMLDRIQFDPPYGQIGLDMLLRNRWTQSQTGLQRKARVQNVKHAFSLNSGKKADALRILLVDDVYTTGATVDECARVLMESGAEGVDVLTLARAI